MTHGSVVPPGLRLLPDLVTDDESPGYSQLSLRDNNVIDGLDVFASSLYIICRPPRLNHPQSLPLERRITVRQVEHL
jgi:hypothetical protein